MEYIAFMILCIFIISLTLTTIYILASVIYFLISEQRGNGVKNCDICFTRNRIHIQEYVQDFHEEIKVEINEDYQNRV